MDISFGFAIFVFTIFAAALYDEAKTFIMRKIYYSKKNIALRKQWHIDHRYDSWAIRKGNCDCHDKNKRRIKSK